MRHFRIFLRFARRLPSRFWLLCLLTALPAQGEDRTYIVQRHDTLFSIARRHGLSASQLAEHNGLTGHAQVYVGQHLRVPGKSPPPTKAEASTAAAPLNQSWQQAIVKAPVSPRRWKYIVIHHSGMPEGSLKSIDHYHRAERHMEHGLAYHFLIGNGNGMRDGEIAVGNRWTEQFAGGHLRSEEQNQIALGICLIGNFDQTKPTGKQLRSLEGLTRALMKRCDLSASTVKVHRQINIVPTECHGSKFPTASFLATLKKSAR